MPRIDYPDTSGWSQEDRDAWSGMLNVSKMLRGASPAVFAGIGALSSSFYSGTDLSPRLREIAILRVGHLSASPYEIFQHEALARQIGMPESEIEGVKLGSADLASFDDEARAVVAFTDEMVKDVRVSDATLALIRSFLSDQTMMDLMAVIGFYMFVCRFLETTGVEFDAEPTAWKRVQK